MKVFADFHQSSLAYSLYLLFTERLKSQLYFPIGYDWFNNGYWKIAEPYGNAKGTIDQYLRIEGRLVPQDGTPVLNDISSVQDNYYSVQEHAHGYMRKCITYEQFMSQPFDIVIASLPEHVAPYTRLCKEHPNKPKLIFQSGNVGWQDQTIRMIEQGLVRNFMGSVKPFIQTQSTNVVFYHQEIDRLFSYREPTHHKKITSFVNLLPKVELYVQYKEALPEFEFRAYGASTPDGVINTIDEMADIMENSMFGWNIKPGGDGFGHVIYDWAFIGRPIITYFSDYKGKLAEELLEEKVTAIDLGRRPFEESVSLIRELSEPEKYTKLCKGMRQRVASCVDYDREQIKIEKFLSDLI